MTLETKINKFVELGKFLGQFSSLHNQTRSNVQGNDLFFDKCLQLIKLSQSHNGWYTYEQVCFSFQSWSQALTEEKLQQWLSNYDLTAVEPKTIALILAGNIPLVGFHDFLSVLLCGHSVLIKTSSNDQHLLPFIASYLQHIAPEFQGKITFTEGRLTNFDAVIATGSNNTARYFEYYFKNTPSIIRKNRNSVAILSGQETHEQLEALGEDIFRYFGLGCRNVSKLFVPKDYSFVPFFEAIFKYKEVIEYEKYANNYDYNKAVFLMSNFKLLDNGFLTLKEDSGFSSPISSTFYEYYENVATVTQRLEEENERIQCVVSNNITPNSIAFGATQRPELWDYADNVDTISFLVTIK
ncbi:MAG: acyl-CoA reductase [Flavobacterium sp.]